MKKEKGCESPCTHGTVCVSPYRSGESRRDESPPFWSKAPGEGRIRARRSDSPDRKPEELSCPGPSDSGRALRMYSNEDESADPFPQGKEVGVFCFPKTEKAEKLPQRE